MAREYKDSGIEWIGQIPKEWDTTRIGNLFSFSSGDSITNEQIKDEGQYKVYGANGVRGFYSTYNLSKPSILLGRVGALCGNVHIVDEKIWVTEHALISQQRYPTIIKYYAYVFSSMNLIQYSKASAQPVISTSTITNLVCPIPDLSEQQFIADILEKKCGEIDTLIALQEKMIEELKAYKQSVITEAVTKGLNPNVPMKDSGIDWIGEIPEHWNVVHPKALFFLRKEKAKEGERQLTASQQYGVIYQDEYMRITGAKIVTVMKDFDILKHVEAGDFVISMRSFQGGLEYSENTGSISSAYVMLIPNLKYVYPKFYRWFFKSICYINALQSTSNMVRDGQAMRYSNFAQVPLYIIPLSEQRDIATFLDEKCSDIDSLIAVKQQKIEELKDYKKSVIYEYVTGKKEVV